MPLTPNLINCSILFSKLIQLLKSGGVRIIPYTINDEKRMEQLIKLGVSGIISDEPELLLEVIRRLESSEWMYYSLFEKE